MAQFKENEDTITGITLNEDNTKLLASSNDGFLAVFDIRYSGDASSDGTATLNSAPANEENFKPDLYALSDNQEEELTGV